MITPRTPKGDEEKTNGNLIMSMFGNAKVEKAKSKTAEPVKESKHKMKKTKSKEKDKIERKPSREKSATMTGKNLIDRLGITPG